MNKWLLRIIYGIIILGFVYVIITPVNPFVILICLILGIASGWLFGKFLNETL